MGQLTAAEVDLEALRQHLIDMNEVTLHAEAAPKQIDGGSETLCRDVAERLDKMATLGGGNFRDFRNNEQVNFLNFNIGQTRRAYVLKEFVASNMSAPADSPPDAGDSDLPFPRRSG